MNENTASRLTFIGATGMRHAVLVAGNPDGFPVLLIHGLGWDHTLWAALVGPLVEAGFRVIAPDLRGMGQSDKPDGAYSIDLYRRDASAILDALAIGEVMVVGFSLGGMIAAALASADVRVTRMVLACCTLHSDPEAERGTEAMLVWAQRDGALAFAQAQAETIWSPGWAAAHPDAVAAFIRKRSAMDQPALHRAFRASYGIDLRSDCSALRIPALVMAAIDDPFVPLAMARTVADAFPGTACEVFQSGHMLPLEQPVAFETSIKVFLQKS